MVEKEKRPFDKDIELFRLNVYDRRQASLINVFLAVMVTAVVPTAIAAWSFMNVGNRLYALYSMHVGGIILIGCWIGVYILFKRLMKLEQYIEMIRKEESLPEEL